MNKMIKQGLLLGAMLAFAPVFAADEAQVYEMTLTVKSTVSMKGNTSSIVCSEPSNDTGLYRKQSTLRIKGLFWGCGCETIGDPIKVENASDTFGYIFWNETTKKVLDGEFVWNILGRIDRRLTKVEGNWTLGDGETFNLTGAGFGMLKDVVDKECCEILNTTIKSMNGNLAGYLTLPSTVVAKGTDDICEKCQVVKGTDDVVAVAPSFTLCLCDDGDTEYTAASGTWRLRYLTAQSKKWSSSSASAPITDIYKFPSYVVTYLNNH